MQDDASSSTPTSMFDLFDSLTILPTSAPTAPQQLRKRTDTPTGEPTKLPTTAPTVVTTTGEPSVAPSICTEAPITDVPSTSPTDRNDPPPTIAPTVHQGTPFPSQAPTYSLINSVLCGGSPSFAPNSGDELFGTLDPTPVPSSGTISPTIAPSDSLTTSAPTVVPTERAETLAPSQATESMPPEDPLHAGIQDSDIVVRRFSCARANQQRELLRKALIRTAGNVELEIQILDFNNIGAEVHSSLCSRNPIGGFSFDECQQRLEDFFDAHFVPTSAPTNAPTQSPVELSGDQEELIEALVEFFGVENCTFTRLNFAIAVTECGIDAYGGRVTTIHHDFVSIVANLSGDEDVFYQSNPDPNVFLDIGCSTRERRTSFDDCNAIFQAFLARRQTLDRRRAHRDRGYFRAF
ncbi:expressed unknown protein [Seminavis robusta]|uniref:Uncharacterized protein n=1 Tax=Seminavis robusta TaxID=568900 RepID=A0A9N8EBM1_9STRA|nr:expressed unknown protein [Seminavis robusta]|eukprot:Sro887_g216310.1 n/a (408) ;mRNA; f:27600-28932